MSGSDAESIDLNFRTVVHAFAAEWNCEVHLSRDPASCDLLVCMTCEDRVAKRSLSLATLHRRDNFAQVAVILREMRNEVGIYGLK